MLNKAWMINNAGWLHIFSMFAILVFCIGVGVTSPSWWVMLTCIVVTFWLKDHIITKLLTRSRNGINDEYDAIYKNATDQLAHIDTEDVQYGMFVCNQHAILSQTKYQNINTAYRIVENGNTHHMTEIILALSVAGLVLGLFYHSVVGITPFQWMHLFIWDIYDMIAQLPRQ